MFEIEVDRARSLVEVSLSGMLTVEEVGAYVAQLGRSIVSSGLRTYSIMVDVSGCPIQSQEVARAMAEHMAAMPKARAIAVVVGDSLARMQARRLFTQPYARIVRDPEQGRRWILAGEEPR